MTTLTNCQKATVYTMNNELISEAWVANPEKGRVTLIFPDNIKERLFLQVRVVFEDPDEGKLTYQCTLSNYHQLGKGLTYSAKCFLALLEDKQESRINLRVLATYRQQVIPCDEHEQFLPKVTVTVTDIGGGGMFFESDYPFTIGQTIHFIFRKEPEPYLISAKILRYQSAAEETHAGYGCHFFNLSQGADAALHRYVYAQDLLQRNKRLL